MAEFVYWHYFDACRTHFHRQLLHNSIMTKGLHSTPVAADNKKRLRSYDFIFIDREKLFQSAAMLKILTNYPDDHSGKTPYLFYA